MTPDALIFQIWPHMTQNLKFPSRWPKIWHLIQNFTRNCPLTLLIILSCHSTKVGLTMIFGGTVFDLRIFSGWSFTLGVAPVGGLSDSTKEDRAAHHNLIGIVLSFKTKILILPKKYFYFRFSEQIKTNNESKILFLISLRANHRMRFR